MLKCEQVEVSQVWRIQYGLVVRRFAFSLFFEAAGCADTVESRQDAYGWWRCRIIQLVTECQHLIMNHRSTTKHDYRRNHNSTALQQVNSADFNIFSATLAAIQIHTATNTMQYIYSLESKLSAKCRN